jgi:microsomal dipeptidase-like Zn-dependent dipeptidase
MRLRRRLTVLLLASACAALPLGAMGSAAESATAATAPAAPAYDLDNGCYTLRVTSDGTSAGADNYVRKNLIGYGTRATAAAAEPIAFEATQLGRYRLYDRGGSVLYESIPGLVWSGSSYGARADWTITKDESGYRIRSTATQDVIGSVSGTLTKSNAHVALVPATGCFTPPSATTGRISAATAPAVNADGTLNGYIDAHAHPMASTGFGGKLFCGQPFAEGGIDVALAACPSHAVGAGALFEAIIAGTDPLAGDDGWPTFKDWPTPTSLLHQQAYYTGIERAWQGGLRVFNALLVGNRVICELYPERVTSCNEMEQLRAEAGRLHQMQDYIDAQSGGPGKGWFRLATTPAQVRAIAAQGKLAVTIGVESSELFDCRTSGDKPLCDTKAIDKGLDELTAMGVSGFYPVHKFDNAFGGTRFDSGTTGAAVNIGNLLSTGHWWTAESCTGPSDNEQPLTNDGIADLLKSVTGLPAGTVLPVYPTGKVCNTRRLTPLGTYLIQQMMKRGMIIHIDHMGVRTAADVLDLAEAAHYSGIVSVHSWSDRAVVARIAKLGGFVTGYAFSASDGSDGQPGFLAEWRANRTASGAGVLTSYGVGSDVDGLGDQPPARLSAVQKPLVYPFTAVNGATFGRQVYGQRTWDVNKDGVAQYGMYADWLTDVLDQAGSDRAELKREFMTGAEAYVRMWEAARAWNR